VARCSDSASPFSSSADALPTTSIDATRFWIGWSSAAARSATWAPDLPRTLRAALEHLVAELEAEPVAVPRRSSGRRPGLRPATIWISCRTCGSSAYVNGVYGGWERRDLHLAHAHLVAPRCARGTAFDVSIEDTE
jgi:hypothetical protein